MDTRDDRRAPQRDHRNDTVMDLSHTVPLSRRTVVGDIPLQQHAYLEIVGPDNSLRGVDLSDEDVDVGRSSDCKLQLLLNNVSRRHARIILRNDEYLLEDLGSTNGTFVNGVRVVRCVLRNNDLIEIGEAKITFVEERTRQAP